MDSRSLLKLKIYAMMIRLSELEKDKRQRIALLEARPKDFTMLIRGTYALSENEYFEPSKLHPKHQKNNKYRFNK